MSEIEFNFGEVTVSRQMQRDSGGDIIKTAIPAGDEFQFLFLKMEERSIPVTIP